LTSNLFAPSLGDRIRVRCDGSTITVYRNEVVEATVTDSFNSSATPLGFHCYNANSKDRVEDFVLVGL
jgi:hypothetical protein